MGICFLYLRKLNLFQISVDMELNQEKSEWFVMNVYAMNIHKAEDALKGENGLPYFIPKRYVLRTYCGKKKRELVPLISNMVFVYATYKQVQTFQYPFSFIGFTTTLRDGRRRPLVVPDDQMESFIKVVSDYDKDLVYYRPNEIELSKGEYIKIVGGEFDGVKGQLLRVKGKRAKQLVVSIPGILSVATVCVEPEYIQKISKEEFVQEKQ